MKVILHTKKEAIASSISIAILNDIDLFFLGQDYLTTTTFTSLSFRTGVEIKMVSRVLGLCK